MMASLIKRFIERRAQKDVDRLAQVPSIQCPRCHWRSFNPNDIRERYCGHCHMFHENMERKI